MRRRKARELVFQLLFQWDFNPDADPTADRTYLFHELKSPDLVRFASDLIDGLRRCRKQVDEALAAAAENWAVERMAATDRNILRLAAYEILYTDTPDRVAINEAIELAKKYGTEQSAAFVNGILDRLMHSKTDAAPPAETNPAQ